MYGSALGLSGPFNQLGHNEMKNLRFIDTASLVLPPGVHEDAREFVEDSFRDGRGKVRLMTRIRGTHSGQLIPGRCYSGWGMKAGTPSWISVDRGGTAGYDKPVLKNHDFDCEPLGRVVGATYKQLKFGDDFKRDWIEPDQGLDHGSGFILLDAEISDAEAVDRVLTRRYSTVSTTQSPLSAWCSFCRTPVDKGCDHPIGSYVEDEDGTEYLVYVATGELRYWEVSYVNAPRQQNAVTVSFKEISDSIAGNAAPVVIETTSRSYCDALQLVGEDPGVRINLCEDRLPSISRLTGKTRASMSKSHKRVVEGAPEGDVVPAGVPVPDGAFDDDKPAADAAPEASEETPKTETPEPAASDAAAPEAESTTPPEETSSDAEEPKTAPAANEHLAAAVKFLADRGLLDLERKVLSDSVYVDGITTESDGHRHAWQGYYDARDQVFRGNTFLTGESDSMDYHGHSIWIKMESLPDSITGATRDASTGPSHMHDFKARIRERLEDARTMSFSVEEIRSVLNSMSDSDEVSKTPFAELSDDVVKAIEGLMPWVDSGKQEAGELVEQLVTRREGEPAGDGDDGMSETLRKTMDALNDHIDRLKADIEVAKQAQTTAEQERDALREELRQDRARVLTALQGLEQDKVLWKSDLEVAESISKMTADELSKELGACLEDRMPRKLKITAASLMAAGQVESPVRHGDETNKNDSKKDRHESDSDDGELTPDSLARMADERYGN